MGLGDDAVSVGGGSSALVGEAVNVWSLGYMGTLVPSSEFCYETKNGKNSL